MKLDTGRKATGVTDIHNGIGLPQRFTGKGVVTGLMDSGLDPNHIAFLDDAGMPRTKRLWNFTSANSVISYETPSKSPRLLPKQCVNTWYSRARNYGRWLHSQ